MNCFLGSILSIAMLELSIEFSSSPLIEACMHCIKLWSKVYVEQHLEALVYFCDEAHTMSQTSTNKHQCWDLILYFCGCIKYVCCPWFEQLGHLCLANSAWAGSSDGEAREEKLHACYLLMCYTACNIIWTYNAHILLASISQNF